MKKINYNNFFKLLFLILQLLQIGIASEIFENCEKKIKLTYPNIDFIKHDIWEIPIKVINEIEKKSRQRFFKPNLHIWKIYNDSSMIGIAILDNVIGKSMPISFLVLFDNYGKILNTEIIKYREPYGGEISSRRWLNQFSNKIDSSSFKVGAEIDGISGATISVNSVSKGIKKITLLFPHLFLNPKR